MLLPEQSGKYGYIAAYFIMTAVIAQKIPSFLMGSIQRLYRHIFNRSKIHLFRVARIMLEDFRQLFRITTGAFHCPIQGFVPVFRDRSALLRQEQKYQKQQTGHELRNRIVFHIS